MEVFMNKLIFALVALTLVACNKREVKSTQSITAICDSPKTMSDCYKNAETDCFGKYTVTDIQEGAQNSLSYSCQ